MASTVTDELLSGLGRFSGDLLRPGDTRYEEARRVYNGMIDRRPALIAQCRNVPDIVASLTFAREHNYEVSVRGGGHGVAGRAVVDGGVMVDLSPMKGIVVDPAGRTARAEGGVIWAELNRETEGHGLAVTGGVVSTTGIAGLTLGGGIGWIQSKYGLALDNVLSAEIVTADGDVLRASEDENSDLFWAIRGGGGNFGVVASFEYRLHPVGPMVIGGLIAHPYQVAGEVLRFYRDFAAGMSEDLSVEPAFIHAPDGSGAKLIGLALCHIGPAEEAEKEIEPLLRFGQPVMTQVGPMPYSALNSMLDDAYPAGSLNYWKSSFLEELSDGAIDTMVEQFGRCPSAMSAVVIEHFSGAVTRVSPTATAFPHREPGYNFEITSAWLDPVATDENVRWTRDAFAALAPFRSKRRYVNYLDHDDTGDRVARAAYGPNYERLSELKQKYDPTNLFRNNVNIKPATT